MTNRHVVRAIFVGFALLVSAQLSAQTLSRAAEKPNAESIAPAGNAQSNGLLTQADVTTGSSATQVALQAGDFFLTGNKSTGYAKIYFRTTVPLTPDSSADSNSNSSGAGSSGSAGASSSATPTNKLSSSATLALLDPYGGILNLSGGYWRRIGPPAYGRTSNGEKGDALDNEGLFVDGRVGLKMINLPDQSSDSAKVGTTSVSPFATASVALRYAHSVYNGDYTKAQGLFEMGMAVTTNIAADTSLSSAFKDNLLAKRSWALSLSLAFQISGNLAITITGSPTSGNGSAADFGKNYQIGVKLLNNSM